MHLSNEWQWIRHSPDLWEAYMTVWWGKQITRQGGNGRNGQNLGCALRGIGLDSGHWDHSGSWAEVGGDVSCTLEKLMWLQAKSLKRARLEGGRQTWRTFWLYPRANCHIKLHWGTFQFLRVERWGWANEPRNSHLERWSDRLQLWLPTHDAQHVFWTHRCLDEEKEAA